MPTENGQLAAIAFQQVKQCHLDLGKLFRDLVDRLRTTRWDRLWSGRDAITIDVSKSIDSEHWMPSKAYRLYKHPDHPNQVEGIVALFFSEDRTLSEPLLVAGWGRFNVPDGKNISSKDIVHPWDFVNTFLNLNQNEAIDPNRVLHLENPGAGSIAEVRVVGADLYSIQTVGDVEALLGKVHPPATLPLTTGES